MIDRADRAGRETLLSPVSIAPNSGAALLVADDARGMTTLWSADLAADAEPKPLFTPPEGEIGEYLYAADSATLIGVRYGLARRTHWLLPDLADLQAKLDATLPESQVRIESLSRDRSSMLVRVTRADAPGRWYILKLDDGRLRRIADVSAGLNGVKLGPVRLERYKARGGMELTCKLTLPAGSEPKSLPVVVMPHGGPWAHDDMAYDHWSQFLASRGYAVLQPNFRGSTGHGTPYLRAGEGQLGLKMQDDLNDALAWAVGRGIANGGRAAIMGASYGGYAAMWGLARDPKLWRCGISVAGVSALQRTVNAFRGMLNARSARSAWERMTPDFGAVSPINRVADIAAPLLLIHGQRDLRVDDGESRRMAARMEAAGKPAELVLLPQGDHDFTREPDRLALLAAAERFLLRHNPPGA